MRGIYWLAESQSFSQEGLCSVELGSYYVCMCDSLSIKPLFYPTTIGCHFLSTKLTFKNRASCIQDGRTATLQMLHFIYFSTNVSTEYFKHAAHSPFFFSKCHLFHSATFFGSCIIRIFHTGCAKI
jgi:hypothetical protein